MKKIKWPTLKGRLKNSLKSRKEAIKQLEKVLPLSPLAKKYLDK